MLVNNAGIDPGGTVTDVDMAVWKQVLEINLNGTFMTMRAAIPRMIEQGGGSIINISSLGGLRCLPGMAPTAPSKAAINMLTRQAALDYGRFRGALQRGLPGGDCAPRCWKRRSVL